MSVFRVRYGYWKAHDNVQSRRRAGRHMFCSVQCRPLKYDGKNDGIIYVLRLSVFRSIGYGPIKFPLGLWKPRFDSRFERISLNPNRMSVAFPATCFPSRHFSPLPLLRSTTPPGVSHPKGEINVTSPVCRLSSHVNFTVGKH